MICCEEKIVYDRHAKPPCTWNVRQPRRIFAKLGYELFFFSTQNRVEKWNGSVEERITSVHLIQSDHVIGVSEIIGASHFGRLSGKIFRVSGIRQNTGYW